MQNEIANTEMEEISVREIFKYLKHNAQLIVFFGVAGLVLSVTMLILKPAKFEAKIQLQMAQKYTTSTKEVNGNDIESPVTLAERLRSSLAYPAEVKRSCDMPAGDELGEYLNGVVKIEPSKILTNVVEVRVEGPSLEVVKGCSNAIVAMIVTQQHSLIEESLWGKQDLVIRYKQLYQEEFQQLEKIKKADLSNFAYLDKVNKISWLRTRIDELEDEAIFSSLHPAKLIVPMSIPKQPVPKKEFQALSMGLFLGLFFGVLIALVREGWRKNS
ncbi:MAG: hypothetical protein HY226_04185 [Candidatus Vogelbacteria bacterium]|nr:hypothetical protein [Candidatus Vogelbacteria bacterium]